MVQFGLAGLALVVRCDYASSRVNLAAVCTVTGSRVVRMKAHNV